LKTRKYSLEIAFKTQTPSPPSLNQFYKSIPKNIEKRWFYQEYLVSEPAKDERRIGYVDLSSSEVSIIIAKAKKVLPTPKFKQEEEV